MNDDKRDVFGGRLRDRLKDFVEELGDDDAPAAKPTVDVPVVPSWNPGRPKGGIIDPFAEDAEEQLEASQRPARRKPPVEEPTDEPTEIAEVERGVGAVAYRMVSTCSSVSSYPQRDARHLA